MAGIKDIANVWKNVKEIDLRPMAEEAQQVLRIALIGQKGSGKHALAAQLRRDPARAETELQTPLLIADLETAQRLGDRLGSADLIILLIDAGAAEVTLERSLARQWADSGLKVLVFANREGELAAQTGVESGVFDEWMDWGHRRVIHGPVSDPAFLQKELVPPVIELLASKQLSLGRHFPLFRVSLAQKLITDTSFSNAAYALSTGVAEVVPILDIPLNVTDMIVLTKNQAFLVYKLGLALGLSVHWQDYVTEFGSVLGGGFLWRQLARQLIGLIPAWGVVPKVAVSYAGTYVVGTVVLQWYLTGRHVSGKQMRQLYVQAFTRGKGLAQSLLSKAPKLRRSRPAAASAAAPVLPAPRGERICGQCGKKNLLDAPYCQYCGQTFLEPVDADEASSQAPEDPAS